MLMYELRTITTDRMALAHDGLDYIHLAYPGDVPCVNDLWDREVYLTVNRRTAADRFEVYGAIKTRLAGPLRTGGYGIFGDHGTLHLFRGGRVDMRWSGYRADDFKSMRSDIMERGTRQHPFRILAPFVDVSEHYILAGCNYPNVIKCLNVSAPHPPGVNLYHREDGVRVANFDLPVEAMRFAVCIAPDELTFAVGTVGAGDLVWPGTPHRSLFWEYVHTIRIFDMP